jgi:hypothetical protein
MGNVAAFTPLLIEKNKSTDTAKKYSNFFIIFSITHMFILVKAVPYAAGSVLI